MTADKKSVFITGGNTGLGLEIVRALCRSATEYTIIVGSRSQEKGESAVALINKEFPKTANDLSVVQIDVESDDSINKAFQAVSSKLDGKLDVLINNAGANLDRDLQAGQYSTREAWMKTWNVNVAGTQVVTETFVPLLLKSADPRLLFITSGTSSLSETTRFDTPAHQRINSVPDAGWPKDLGMNPVTIYRSSKTGLNMLVREWHRLLKKDNVKVFAVSPGFLATGLAGIGPEKLKQMGALDPSEGGNFVKEVTEGQRDQDAGLVVHAKGVQPW